MTGGLIVNEQGGFRVGSRYIDHIFTLKQISEKAQEKKMQSVCEFHRFGEGM